MKNLSFLMLAALFIFVACEKETVETTTSYDQFAKAAVKVDLCHYDADTDTWHVISVSENALNAHLNHGDVLLVDADGDGYVAAENECVPGGDCDDLDATIYPGAEEICGDEIDNNCNGEIDEDCAACPDCEFNWILENIDLSEACISQSGLGLVIYTYGQIGNYSSGIVVFNDGLWYTGADYSGVGGNTTAECVACYNEFVAASGLPTCNLFQAENGLEYGNIFGQAATLTK